MDLARTRTETAQSLKELGVNEEVPQQDFNFPPVEDPVFPEEYTLETPTGLVPVEKLQSIGRTKLRASQTTAKTEPKELDPEIEFVTFHVNDPENPTTGTSGSSGSTPSSTHGQSSLLLTDHLL